MLLSTTNVIVVHRNHHTVRNNVFYTGGNGMTIAISLDGEHIIGNLGSAEVSITTDELQYVYATIVDGRLQLRTTTKQITPLPPHHEREEGSFYQEGDVLYLYQRGGLEITSRVDIATIHNRRYIEEAPTYQESGIPSIKHGEIVFDIQGRPIVRGNGYLLTTTIFDDLGIAISDELEPLLLSTKANHNISKNKIVKIVLLDELRSELASYNDMDVELLGVALNSAEKDENLLVAIQAIVNIKTDGEIGDRLYIGDGSRKGDLITYNPRELHYKNIKKNSIGKVLPNNSIIFGQSNEVLEAVFRRQSRFLGLLPALRDRLGLVRVSAEPTEHNNPIAVETTDPRLYDARMPLPHTHSMVDIEIPDDFDWGVSGDFDPNEPVEEPDSIIEWIRYLNTTKLDISDSRLYDSREALPHTHFAREIDVESFGLTPKNSLQGAIERLQGELIGPEGGQIDGVLTINKTPTLSRDIVNLDYIEGIRINQLQVVKVSRGDIELAAGETRSFTISFSEAGVYKVGNLIRGMIYYSSVSSESAVTMNVLDSSTGLIYTSSNAGGGAEIDLTPVTADFTGDMIIQLVNSGGATVVGVNLSYVVLDGNEAILLEDGESEIIVNSAALGDVELRDILRRLNTTSENIEVGDASVVVDYFGLNLIELDFEEHGLSEDMAPTEGAVVSGGIFDKSELIELYDEICIACMVHADEWNDYCASEEHFLACQEAANVIESEEATIEELDDAIIRLRSSTFVAFFTSGQSGTIAVDNLNAPYTVKFRRKGYNTPFDEWEVTGNSFSTTANFPNAAEVFITLKDKDVVSSSGNSSISIRGNSTLDKIVTWGELGTRQFIMQGSTRAFEVPNWLPSSVTNMSGMFQGCANFNSPNVSGWDTSNNISLYHTFSGAWKFNQNINSWSTDNVTTLDGTFREARDFNQPLNNWNTSRVTGMNQTFLNSNFNQDINNWDTSKVTRMNYTFSGTPFNKPLNSWNVGLVTTMAFMFADSSFNQPLSNWNPKNVTNMSFMFKNSPFNRPLAVASGSNNYMNPNRWDTRKVTNMDYMFSGSAFNQQTIDWRVENVLITKDFPGFRRGADDETLNAPAWARTRPRFGMGAPTSQYNTTEGTRDVFMIYMWGDTNIRRYIDNRRGTATLSISPRASRNADTSLAVNDDSLSDALLYHREEGTSNNYIIIKRTTSGGVRLFVLGGGIRKYSFGTRREVLIVNETKPDTLRALRVPFRNEGVSTSNLGGIREAGGVGNILIGQSKTLFGGYYSEHGGWVTTKDEAASHNKWGINSPTDLDLYGVEYSELSGTYPHTYMYGSGGLASESLKRVFPIFDNVKVGIRNFNKTYTAVLVQEGSFSTYVYPEQFWEDLEANTEITTIAEYRNFHGLGD